jgi:gluconate 2-dehydrogenase gamma chain
MTSLPRRGLFAGLAAAGASLQSAAPADAAQTPPPAEPWLTLNLAEAAFVTAAVATLVPPDELSPSGADLGIAVYIDRQLAGAWGSGARYYRQGPHIAGRPEHGPQSPLTPREQFRAGIAEAGTQVKQRFGKGLDELPEPDRIAALQDLETKSPEIFNLLLTLTMEGLFADPIYGGNRNKAGWNLLGYPGLPATYRRDIRNYHGRRYDKPARSIADFS